MALRQANRLYAQNLKINWNRTRYIRMARANQILEARREQNLTQKSLSELVGLDPSKIAKAEKFSPTNQVYTDIRQALNLDDSTLIPD